MVNSCPAPGLMVPSGTVSLSPRQSTACLFSTPGILQGTPGSKPNRSLCQELSSSVTFFTKGCWAPVSADLPFLFICKNLSSLNYSKICDSTISSRASQTKPCPCCHSPLPSRTAALFGNPQAPEQSLWLLLWSFWLTMVSIIFSVESSR